MAVSDASDVQLSDRWKADAFVATVAVATDFIFLNSLSGSHPNRRIA
ncbi:MAG TPA: hypothetical protein VK642_06050 [Burkholderiales bacterium]|nr:hypothetical protein [Burkholderiales bacterium]